VPASQDKKNTISAVCDKYEGTDGSDRDTYSVLASFGANVDGQAGADASARGKGSIAQYFATGWAARALAQKGGAALVNNVEFPLSAAQLESVDALESFAKRDREVILAAVQDSSDATKIDKSKMVSLLDKATGATSLSSAARMRFGAADTATELRKLLAIYDTDAAKLAVAAK
jgi:hypothetical protein